MDGNYVQNIVHGMSHLITLQDMAHRTDFLNPDGARATNLKVDILVYMAWCDLRSRNFYGEQE